MIPVFKYIFTPTDELEDTLNEYAQDGFYLFSAQFVDNGMAHVILVSMPNPNATSMVHAEEKRSYN
jgi:hypothetical protein